MKKIRAYINQSITRRLFINFVMLALIPLIVLQLVTTMINASTTRRMVSTSTQREVEVALQNMEQIFSNVEALCEGLQDNPAFQERMRATYLNLSSQFSEELEGNMDLASIASGDLELHGLYVLGKNKLCCKSNTNDLRYSDFLNTEWYSNALAEKTGRWYGFHSDSFVVQVFNQRFISFCVPYIDQANGKANGVIVAEIGEDIITPIFSRSSSGDNLFLLLDNQYEVLYEAPNDWMSPAMLDEACTELTQVTEEERLALEEGGSVVREIDGALVVYQYSPTTGWFLVGALPTSYIDQNLNYVLAVTLSILVLVLVVSAILSSFMAKQFTRPIIELQTAMKSVEEGDLAVSLEVRGQNEMAALAGSFNHMVKRIRKLMNSIYEKQTKLRKLEFRALQAQINPHFLYNSLDSIVWLLRMDRTEDAITMLQNLTVLFRISLSKGHEMIPIRSELRHLNSYIAILSMRYSRRFEAQVEADESLYDYISLKLMLQPLVENSVYHGISVEKPVIHIRVSVVDGGEDILFCVEDDGVGMSAEQLEKLRSNISQVQDNESVLRNPQGGGYGLRNVDERIKLYFGQQYGLSIDSTPGVGTAITIRIPKRTETEQDAQDMINLDSRETGHV